MGSSTRRFMAGMLLLFAGSAAWLGPSSAEQQVTPRSVHSVDPASWGRDHVGKRWPAYVTGDECLFCHRDTGATWSENPHQRTIRPALPDDPALRGLWELPAAASAAAETRYLIGSHRITRFLKRSAEYGKLEILTTSFVPNTARSPQGEDRRPDEQIREISTGILTGTTSPQWDVRKFGNRCAGCHATAVDSRSRAFAAMSLDCVTCHGDVDLDHTKDIRLVLLSKTNQEPRQVMSLCGQCHLRGGTSRSTGLPYPNTFVAGDNLFRDFQVDFSDKAIANLPAAEQHIWISTRDVAVREQKRMSCLTCHDVHRPDTEKHKQLSPAGICASCHVPGSENTKLREGLLPVQRRQTSNRVCEY